MLLQEKNLSSCRKAEVFSRVKLETLFSHATVVGANIARIEISSHREAHPLTLNVFLFYSNQETISAKRLELQPVFVLREVNTDGSNDNEVLNYCGVEEMALRYYRKQGYNEGIHGEGLTFTMLFTLLMWDVIFCDSVPDVFRTPFQVGALYIGQI